MFSSFPKQKNSIKEIKGFNKILFLSLFEFLSLHKKILLFIKFNCFIKFMGIFSLESKNINKEIIKLNIDIKYHFLLRIIKFEFFYIKNNKIK